MKKTIYVLIALMVIGMVSAELGEELVSNNDFTDCPNGWVDNGDWACGGLIGVLDYISMGSKFSSRTGVFSQSISITIGKQYNISTYISTITNPVDTELKIELGNINSTITTAGWNSFLITPISTDDLKIHGFTDSGETIRIFNISVREVLPEVPPTIFLRFRNRMTQIPYTSFIRFEQDAWVIDVPRVVFMRFNKK